MPHWAYRDFGRRPVCVPQRASQVMIPARTSEPGCAGKRSQPTVIRELALTIPKSASSLMRANVPQGSICERCSCARKDKGPLASMPSCLHLDPKFNSNPKPSSNSLVQGVADPGGRRYGRHGCSAFWPAAFCVSLLQTHMSWLFSAGLVSAIMI